MKNKLCYSASKILLLSFGFVIMVSSLSRNASAAVPASSLTVVRVTSLADSGPGTLRDCVLKTTPRICVFETSGRIVLKDQLIIRSSDIVIAGQTAPSPGIVVTGAGIVARASNVSVEHLSVRVGDNRVGPPPDERDSIGVWGPGTTNVTFRNISASWSIDENFGTWDTISDIRIEDSIFSEGLLNSIHPKGAHSMGALVNGDSHRITFIGNLFAANEDRNVRWKGGSDGAFIGNVVYGWGGTSSWNITNITDLPTAKATKLDVIGNVFIPGPDGSQDPFVVYADPVPSGTRVYLSDNIAPRLTNLTAPIISSSRLSGSEKPRQPASQTLAAVVARAGSRPWERNSIDKRVIDGVTSKTLRIRSKINDWPVVEVTSRKLKAPAETMSLAQMRSWLQSFEVSSVDGPQSKVSPSPVPTSASTPIPIAPTRSAELPTPSATDVVPAPTIEVPGFDEPTPRGDEPSPSPTPPLPEVTITVPPTPSLVVSGPFATPIPTPYYPWLTSARSWRHHSHELCCTKRGRKKLSAVLAEVNKPGFRRKCRTVDCD